MPVFLDSNNETTMGKLYDELTPALIEFIEAQKMFFVGTRDYYDNYAEKLGAEGMRTGQLAVNMNSIDGLPGLSKPSM